MTINLHKPDITELKPRITVFGVGGGGGNAVNNMINAGLKGVDFVVANTDAQALAMSKSERLVQLGVNVTEGLGAGSQPEVGRAAAEECIDELIDHLSGTHMCFVTAGMGGGTGTGAAPVVARAAREKGILTVGVVTKPFHFEGQRRMATADAGIEELQKNVDTLIVIPNQNLFRIANDKTTFADAFAMADQVLYSGVACITDLMVKEGLINLDFADVRSVMREMGKAMMGTGEASGEGRAMAAAEAAIANPLLDETSMRGAGGLLISITGGRDLTLFEVDEAATRIREEVDPDANIILGATFDEELEGVIRVSVVATGIDRSAEGYTPIETPRPVTRAVQPRATVTSAPQRAAIAARAEQTDMDEIEAIIAETEADVVAASRDTEAEFRPQSRVFKPEPAIAAEVAAPAKAPVPERPATTATVESDAEALSRMPRVEDFPPVVKDEISARTAPAQEAAHEERGPLGLLKRLTSGLNHRREDEVVELEPTRQREPQLRPAAEVRRPQPAEPVAKANPRAAHLDDHGRAAPQLKSTHDEGELEIPAFLRRQVN
ncbi:MAG: cell division protein FtsZ [Brucellaceae bacterium]|nr:cell division protein FtsZ [Brucellaceae bacterium]